MAYKNASEREQARLRRPTASITGDGIDDLTNAQKLENIISVFRRNEARLGCLKGLLNNAEKFERMQLIKDQAEFREQIVALKKVVKQENIIKSDEHNQKRNDYFLKRFMNIVKSEVSEDQFKIWLEKAKP
jgi:hypothetical protein